MDEQSMQGSMGIGASYSMGAVGIPTPAVPLYQTMHPGMASQMAVQQAAMQAEYTRSSAFNTSGSYAAMMGSPSAFASQYASNMGVIQSHMRMGPYTGFGGMMPGMGMGGMMPPPGMFTAPELGVYRNNYPQIRDTYAFNTPHALNMFNPLVFQPQTTMFRSPMQAAQDNALASQGQNAAMLMTAGSMAGRGITDVTAGILGARIGAALGSLAGPGGAVAGMTLGRLGGVAAAEMSGVAGSVGNAVSNFTLATPLNVPLQMQQLSKSMFIGGPAASNMGLGITPGAAMELAPTIQRMSYNRVGGFNTADFPKIMQAAGESGLFNDIAGLDQGGQRLAKMAKALKSLMQITNDPDVISAIKQLGNMRMMGADLETSLANFKSIRGYARMAGLSPQGAENAANAGALLFQNFGLTGATGMVAGVGAAGMARQTVAAGVFTPLQRALLGGEQGMAQRTLESNLAFMRTPALTAFLATQGAGGNYRVDMDAVKELLSGKVDLDKLTTGGINNLNTFVAKRGLGALSVFNNQSAELQEQTARYAGPAGVDAMKKLLLIGELKRLNLDKTPEGLSQAIGMLFPNDPNMQRQMLQELSPTAIRGVIQGLMNEKNTQVAERIVERKNMPGPGFLTRTFTGMGMMDYGTGARLSEDFFISGNTAEKVRRFIGKYQQSSRMGELVEQGLTPFELPPFLEAGSQSRIRDLETPFNAATATNLQKYGQSQARSVLAEAAQRTAAGGALLPAEAHELLRYRGGLGKLTAKPSVMFSMLSDEIGLPRVIRPDDLSPNNRRELQEYQRSGRIIGGGLNTTLASATARGQQLRSVLGMDVKDYNDLIASIAGEFDKEVSAQSETFGAVFGQREGVTKLPEAVKRVMARRGAFSKLPQDISAGGLEDLYEQLGKEAMPLVNLAANPALAGMSSGAAATSAEQARSYRSIQQTLEGRVGEKLGIEGTGKQAELVRFLKAVNDLPSDLPEADRMYIAAKALLSQGTVTGDARKALTRVVGESATAAGRTTSEMEAMHRATVASLANAPGVGVAAPLAEQFISNITPSRFFGAAALVGETQRQLYSAMPVMSHITGSDLDVPESVRQDLMAALQQGDFAKAKGILSKIPQSRTSSAALTRLIDTAKSGTEQDFTAALAQLPTQAAVALQPGSVTTSVDAGLMGQEALLVALQRTFPDSVKQFEIAVNNFALTQKTENARGVKTIDPLGRRVDPPNGAAQAGSSGPGFLDWLSGIRAVPTTF